MTGSVSMPMNVGVENSVGTAGSERVGKMPYDAGRCTMPVGADEGDSSPKTSVVILGAGDGVRVLGSVRG